MMIANNFIIMNQPQYLQTRQNCLNNSTSKQLFSFTKQIRFRPQKHITSQTNFLSASHSQDRMKACSFGKSRKQLVFQNQQQQKLHPPPNLYYSQTKQNHNKSGITMGVKLKYIQNINKSNQPGPSTYSTKSLERNHNSIVFSRQKRVLKFPIDNQKGLDTPGPYLIKTQRLKQILSSYNKPRTTKITNKSNNIDLNAFKLKLKAQQLKIQLIKNMNSQIKKQTSLEKYKNNEVLKSSVFKKPIMTIFGKQSKKSIFDVKNFNPSPTNYACFSQFAKRNKPNQVKSGRSSVSIRIKSSRNQSLIKQDQKKIKSRLKTLPVAF